MNEQIEKVHKIQFDIAKEAKKICQNYGIDYFLIAGTLLGAVRHNGFIPWDDDLDIGMFRDDYEKFIEIAKSELPSRFFLQTWDTDKKFGLPFAKLRLNGTKYIEKNSSKVGAHEGIFIDIFPFDNVPKRKVEVKIQKYSVYIFKRLILAKLRYELWNEQEKGKKLIYRLIRIPLTLIPLSILKRILNNNIRKYNTLNPNSKYITNIGGAYGYSKETVKREWFNKIGYMSFEDEKLSIPIEYDKYLSYFYGDYMTPPPVDQRFNRHNIQVIDFGDYD